MQHADVVHLNEINVVVGQDKFNRLDALFDPEPWKIPESAEPVSNDTGLPGFGPTLASYVASLVVGIDGEEDWVLKLADYDFSAARGQLVMSRPCLGPQSISPSPTWRNSVQADDLLGEVETMIVMPDASYYEHYYDQGRQAGSKGVKEPKKLVNKIEDIEVRAAARCASQLVSEVILLETC